jgi:hypothetical protein
MIGMSNRERDRSLTPEKAAADDFAGRFREIISDPVNLLIERVPQAGVVDDGLVWLHNGNRVAATGDYAYYGEFSSILSLNRGVHEPLEEYVFQETIKHLCKAPVMLELGCYWAHYSMWLAKHRQDASLFLVDPNAANLAVGKRNFQINGFLGEFIEAMVAKDHFEVDQFCARAGLADIDILHADIQGYELEMLDSAWATLLNQRIKYAFVSTHSQAYHAAVENVFEQHGYRVEISSDFELDTTSHDGLVFASRSDLAPVLNNFKPLGRSEIVSALPSELLSSLLKREARSPK